MSDAGRLALQLPPRMRRLPRNKVGYVVPWFVAWIDGKPDFRVIREGGIADAYNGTLCWLCGQHLGANAAFVIGPMCAINRVSAEPPSHRDCATYAARACPFLANPRMVRRDHFDFERGGVAGTMIPRNPGVALVWVTRDWSPFRALNGVLFDVGEPIATEWYAHGRPATRAEVDASIEAGYPSLLAAAEQGGPDDVAHLEQQRLAALPLLPRGAHA